MNDLYFNQQSKLCGCTNAGLDYLFGMQASDAPANAETTGEIGTFRGDHRATRFVPHGARSYTGRELVQIGQHISTISLHYPDKIKNRAAFVAENRTGVSKPFCSAIFNLTVIPGDPV